MQAALLIARQRLIATHAARRRVYGNGDPIAPCVSLQIMIVDQLIAARAGELPSVRWRIPKRRPGRAVPTESETPAAAGRL